MSFLDISDWDYGLGFQFMTLFGKTNLWDYGLGFQLNDTFWFSTEATRNIQPKIQGSQM
jgi:hypothetical protein